MSSPQETPEELKLAFAEYKATVMDKKNMSPNYVIKLPLLEQAEYADPITKKYANDTHFINTVMANFRGIDENTTACTIGNLAYLANTHKNETLLLFLSALRGETNAE